MRDSVVKWLEALRSGEFEQGTGKLECNGKYCCLGVACVVAEREGVPVDKNSNGCLTGYYLLAQPDTQSWLNLKEPNGHFGPYGQNLVSLNDNGKTFAEIADIIESKYDDLFHPEEET